MLVCVARRAAATASAAYVSLTASSLLSPEDVLHSGVPMNDAEDVKQQQQQHATVTLFCFTHSDAVQIVSKCP